MLTLVDRDPEAEAEEKAEEEKAAVVEEEPAAVETFAGGDWEAAPAGFAATAAAATGWDDAAPNQQWSAETGGAQWGDEATAKETTQW